MMKLPGRGFMNMYHDDGRGKTADDKLESVHQTHGRLALVDVTHQLGSFK